MSGYERGKHAGGSAAEKHNEHLDSTNKPSAIQNRPSVPLPVRLGYATWQPYHVDPLVKQETGFKQEPSTGEEYLATNQQSRVKSEPSIKAEPPDHPADLLGPLPTCNFCGNPLPLTMPADRYAGSRDHYSSRRDDYRDRDRDRRHRSRSPHHRGARRDYEGDTYTSSRDYREREREDRYRDRRDDRAWDRDRHRRDRRDDDRPPRRDRDLFDDRRRGRDDREPRGGPRQDRERKKSASPPRKKREPTPDLTDIVPVLERRRRMTQWDIKPPGYEKITAEQAKLSGMFPLPGAPRTQAMDPKQLQAFMGNSASTANSASLNPTTAKQSKRLFVYNLPPAVVGEDSQITEFFNLQLNGSNIISAEDPCISTKTGPGGEYALLEFKTPEDATAALALTGINMLPEDTEMVADGAANGYASGLDIRRPKDYIVPMNADNSESRPGQVKDSPNKICIRNIPPYLNDEQITELIAAFGEVRAFVLAKDMASGQSKGFAFCEYSDPSTTDIAVEGLNEMELGENNLKVARASIGATQASGIGGAMGVSAMSMLAGTQAGAGEESQGRVLQLLNMITAEELMDNTEYQEICEDIKEECVKFGEVVEMKVPRPTTTGGRSAPGVGKIYLKYDSNASAQKAISALAGRKFADRTVVVTWFSEEYFDTDAW